MLLVDDHDLFRTGLRNLLEEQGVEIVGEAASGSEALRFVRETAPDVVVMDLNMPGMSGVEATRHISRDAPLTRVIVLTISDEEQDVMDAILAGACGYLLKDASIQELMRGLEAAAVGESLISSHIAGKVLQHVRATTAAPEAAATIRAELSDREIQVLKLIANGKDNADDRRRAPHQPEDGQEPHLEHPDEAPDRQPHPGRRLRGPVRNRLVTFARAARESRARTSASSRSAAASWSAQLGHLAGQRFGRAEAEP